MILAITIAALATNVLTWALCRAAAIGDRVTIVDGREETRDAA